jgi:mRNA-degrading endonuclease toxin of MazEF toxin-antitoxin module
MKSFLTPDPITLEIRNAAGEIQIVLTDTQSTTVDVSAGTGHPLGFLDDVFKAFGSGRGFGRGRSAGFPGFRGSPSGEQSGGAGGLDTAETLTDITDLVRIEHREGDRPAIIVDTDPARDGWRTSFTVVVTAPLGSNLRVQAQSSDVVVTGTASLVDVRTASGRTQLEETGGKTLVQSASGDVRISLAGGNVDVRTASGDVVIGPVRGDALVHTTSGDVELGAVTGNINARSVSGDVRVADATSGLAEVNAVSGDVEIGIHAGSVAAISLSTVSGSTDTDFEVAGEAPEGHAPVLEITVKTTSGDIRLHRAA